MFVPNPAKIAIVSTLVAIAGCADTHEAYDVRVTIYNAETGQTVEGEDVRISYDRSEEDKYFRDRPDGDGQFYTTNEEGQFTAVVYKVEDAALIIAIGAAIYDIPTTALEPDAEVERGEKDRQLDRREIPYLIDLTFEVIN